MGGVLHGHDISAFFHSLTHGRSLPHSLSQSLTHSFPNSVPHSYLNDSEFIIHLFLQCLTAPLLTSSLTSSSHTVTPSLSLFLPPSHPSSPTIIHFYTHPPASDTGSLRPSLIYSLNQLLTLFHTPFLHASFTHSLPPTFTQYLTHSLISPYSCPFLLCLSVWLPHTLSSVSLLGGSLLRGALCVLQVSSGGHFTTHITPCWSHSPSYRFKQTQVPLKIKLIFRTNP